MSLFACRNGNDLGISHKSTLIRRVLLILGLSAAWFDCWNQTPSSKLDFPNMSASLLALLSPCLCSSRPTSIGSKARHIFLQTKDARCHISTLTDRPLWTSRLIFWQIGFLSAQRLLILSLFHTIDSSSSEGVD